MKTWLVKELGEPKEVLMMEEVDRPVRLKHEVLVKVKAASLNFFDILLCQGKYQEKASLPFTFGSEISGEVVESRKDGPFKEGQRVIAFPILPNGGLAEYVSVPESQVFLIPKSIPWCDAAAMSVTYRTAFYALCNRAKLKEREVLLVHAGAGGVGSAAIQLGKAFGAKVIATAGGSDKTEVCKGLGADIAVDYLKENFVEVVKRETSGKGADVIFDPVGGDIFYRSRKCIAFDGRILVIGFAGGTIPNMAINHVLIKNYSIVGVHYGYYAKLFPDQVMVEHEGMMKLYQEGKIKPLIYEEYPFEKVPEAITLLGARKTWGKVIVKIS
ncbi:NADPH:quinone oxidoreductase family protein [Neobacillus niacini]|uniref:NADPH:quinone oxidoreductase family protein n=1 Tax=Neobacillus niacini TaxID=86668 RepID=UPI002FFD8AE4